jgi:hypothetical protein
MASLTSLPPPIRRGLLRIDARLRAIRAGTGLGSLALVLALGAVLGMAADVALVLPLVVRWMLWLAWVAAAVVVLVVLVIGPLVSRFTWADLAAVAEAGHPQLCERLTSTVDFLAQNQRHLHGSPALIAALTEETTNQAERLNLALALSSQRAIWRLGLGGLALLVVLAPSVVRPDPFRPLLGRWLAPWADIDRVGRFVIDVEPGDHVAALGAELPISATVRPRFGSAVAPDQAWLEWTEAGGRSHRARMAAESNDRVPWCRFTSTLPRLTGSLRYRVTTAETQSRRHAISAVAPPAVTALSIKVEPPAYTRITPAIIKDPARIEAWEGSRIIVHLTTNKAVDRASIEWPGEPSTKTSQGRSNLVPMSGTGPSGRQWNAILIAKATGHYTFTLRDAYKISNFPEPNRRVIVRPDAPPSVALSGPETSAETRADDVLSLEVDAHDDLAVASAEIHYAIERFGTDDPQELGQEARRLPGLGTRHAIGEAVLDLKPLHLKPGDLLHYRVRVTDSLPPPRGPNVAWTPIKGLTITEKAESLLARKSAAERNAVQVLLDALKRLAATNHQETTSLRYAADAVLRGNGQWDAARERAVHERTAAAGAMIDRLEGLARAVGDHPQYAPLARPARQVAQVEGEGSREMLVQAARQNDPARRLDDLKQADNRLAAVRARLDDLQRLFDALARQDEDRRRLRALAERQDDLAAQAARLAGQGDPARLEQIQNEQARLTREVDELAKQSPSLRAELLEAKAKEASALAERARELADHQRAEARQTAGLNRDDPRLRALAKAQQALEDDARRLAMQVDQPLQEEGRGRLNAEALHRPLDPIERGDIAQGRQALEQAEDELRRLTRDLEDVQTDSKALARRLARRQEALRSQVQEAIRDADLKDQDRPTREDRQALSGRFKPLAAREEAIHRLAAAIPAPGQAKQSAENAVRKTQEAADALKAPSARDADRRQQEAVNALHRLADILPDDNQIREPARQKLAQARQRAEEVAREVERHLHETEPQSGRSLDPDAAAGELARRVAPLAQRQNEVATSLAELTFEDRAERQRLRAAQRALALARALDGLGKLAPATPPKERKAQPAADWHVLGTFAVDQAPPFSPNTRIDLKAIHKDRKRENVTWKPVRPADGSGLVDLGQIYNEESNQAAFGYAEFTSPASGKGQLALGSDDTLTVWLNGKQVYRFEGDRSINVGQDNVDVDVVEGVNRVIVRCGNHSGQWKFALAVRTPEPMSPEERTRADLARSFRSALPALALDARASLERLEQKLNRQVAADDLAADLAAESSALRDVSKPANVDQEVEGDEVVQEERRIATALRNLNAPDARLEQAEAIRAADRAARALADPEAAKRDAAVQEAARAADALSKRLTSAHSPPEQGAAMARSKRSPPGPTAPRDRGAGTRTPREVLPADLDLPLSAKHAIKARELARRERHIREQLQAVLGERVPPQERLREDSAALGRQVADLRDQAREFSPPSQGPAHAAADTLTNQAPQVMGQGSEQLAQGRAHEARETQRRAAELVERAAQQIEDLAAALRADRPPESGDPADEGTSTPASIASARDAQREAARQLSQAEQNASSSHSTQAASTSMRQAAAGLRTASQPSRSRVPGGPALAQQGDPSADSVLHSNPARRAEADLAELQAMIRAKTGRNWGELPGHLRTEILQMSRGRYRDDYARLIRLYFQEIASGTPARGNRP